MTLIRLVEVKKHFGSVKAVDGITTTIDRGFVSLIGPNGAGKTTLVNLISGRLKPSSGKIFLNNREITHLSESERVALGITRSFQLPMLFYNLSTYENCSIPHIIKLKLGMELFRHVKRFREIDDLVTKTLNNFMLSERGEVVAKNIPHGDKKLLDVAMPFSLDAKIILLDEPTSGLSLKEKDEVMDIIYRRVEEEGIAVLAVEHDLDVVFKYSDKILVMHQGKLIAEGEPDEIKHHPEVLKVMGLHA